MEKNVNAKRGESWLLKEQPKLGAIGTLVLLVLAGLMVPFALDMYTPAIPHMVDYLNTTPEMVNYTLVGFFGASAIGLLLFGTVSDKYGRKPVFLAGAAGYTIASVLCALSSTIEMLIAARIIQALAAGAMGAIGTAVVKDAFKPEYREKVLSVVQVMFVVGPVCSPVVGALLLQVTDWRGIFVALTLIGVLLFVLGLLLEEPLSKRERTRDAILPTIGHLGSVFKCKGFVSFLMVMAIFGIPFMAYIAVGSYIYIDFFGLSEITYSEFFAVGAVAGSVGPFIWLFVQKYMSAKTFTTVLLAIALTAGVGLMVFGEVNEFVFCAIFVVYVTAESCARPYSTNILLSQHDGETGAASSVINFVHTVFGCGGMLLAVLPWPSYPFGVGAILVLCICASLAIWAYLLRKPVLVRGLND